MFAFTKRKLLSDKAALGKWGEKRCEKFLKKQGYRTLARNYSCKTGELDLVMADPRGAVVFIEVKTRTSNDFAEPQDSITTGKKIKLKRTAGYFINVHKIQKRPHRFDVITVILDSKNGQTIKHYPNAFTL